MRIRLCLIFALLMYAGLNYTSGFAQTQNDTRGLWVVRYTLTSPGRIDTLLSDAREWKITDLYVQVRGRGDAYYNSRLEPKAEAIADPAFDPLGYLLKQNRKYGFRIHAWLNVFYVWSNDTLPADKTHVVRRRAEWLALPFRHQNLLGDYPNSIKQNHSEGLYLSPLKAEVQQNFIEIVRDILGKYAVDGIHLDYVRFPNRNFDVHPDIIRDFRRRYVLDPDQFLLDPQQFADKYSVAGYEAFSLYWRRYLMDGLSEFIRRLAADIRHLHPAVLISAAVKPDISLAHWEYYQDWDRWLREGWLDFAVPMNYTPDSALFNRRLNTYLDKLPAHKYRIGIALYNQSPEQALPKIARSRALRNGGFVLFSYRQLKKQMRIQNYLRNGMAAGENNR